MKLYYLIDFLICINPSSSFLVMYVSKYVKIENKVMYIIMIFIIRFKCKNVYIEVVLFLCIFSMIYSKIKNYCATT